MKWRSILTGVTALTVSISSMSLVAFAQESSWQTARLTESSDIPTQLGDIHGPLSLVDARNYQAIFEAQEDGDWARANRLIDKIGNDILMGHVKAERLLHPTAYRSSYAELEDWLSEHADLPQSSRIYKLATKRRPKGAEEPPKPVAGYLGGSGQELIQERLTDYQGPKDRDAQSNRVVAAWLKQIKSLVSRDRPTQATKSLQSSAAKTADNVEFDIARWTIAKGYLANLKDELAWDYASKAADRSGHVEPRMHWTAGLAAWRLDRKQNAAKHFSALAQSEAQGEERAAGAFWAARAFQSLKRFDKHQSYLRIAAAASDEFYGQLAQRVLGNSSSFDWHEAGLRGEMRGLVARFPATRRAMALAQAGQSDLAAKEIRKIAARARPQLTQALAALAERLALPATQMRVAQRLRLQDGRRHDGAMFPVPPWEPEGGFRVDRALVYALVRAESGFNPRARSHAGAMGLMQVLPSTARMVAKRSDIVLHNRRDLFEPAKNLEIGQAYVARLLDNQIVDDNIFLLAIAYNAGLKRLEDWKPRFADFAHDPLLFVESIPIPETRVYAKKLMANLWAYRARLDQTSPSLTDLAQSQWPIYTAVDENSDYAWAN